VRCHRTDREPEYQPVSAGPEMSNALPGGW
jgi:hypothetical protein